MRYNSCMKRIVKFFVLGALFLSAPCAYAGSYIQNDAMEQAYDANVTGCRSFSNAGNFGYNTSYFQFATFISVPVDFTLQNVKMDIGVSNTPTDTLEMSVYSYDPTSDAFSFLNASHVASSSEVTATTSGLYTFEFADVELTAGTYVFSVRRTGPLSTTNFYNLRTAQSCYLRGTQSYETRIMTQANGNAIGLTGNYFLTIRGETPESEGGIMECDMASTTDAVYAVGYSMQLYLGILILLIFAIGAFFFVRGYINKYG